MVSLGAVEDFVHRLSPEHAHAVVALPDPRKGERIVLVTTDQSLERDTLLKAAREGGINELMLPAEVIHRPELPLLGTGKTDYPSVQKIVSGVSGGGVRTAFGCQLSKYVLPKFPHRVVEEVVMWIS